MDQRQRASCQRSGGDVAGHTVSQPVGHLKNDAVGRNFPEFTITETNRFAEAGRIILMDDFRADPLISDDPAPEPVVETKIRAGGQRRIDPQQLATPGPFAVRNHHPGAGDKLDGGQPDLRRGNVRRSSEVHEIGFI